MSFGAFQSSVCQSVGSNVISVQRHLQGPVIKRDIQRHILERSHLFVIFVESKTHLVDFLTCCVIWCFSEFSLPERWFKCDFCPKTFTRTCNKERHSKTHTGEKPFVCHICRKQNTLSRFSDLLCHLFIDLLIDT